MRSTLLYILLLLTTTSYAQPYDNNMRYWCKVELKGKVKEIRRTYHPDKPQKVGYKTFESVTKVSYDGYIIETSTKIDNKKASLLEYQYISNNNKAAGYIIKGKLAVVTKKHNTVRNILDSVSNEITIDTVNMLIYNRSNVNSTYYSTYQRQYIYNKQKQLKKTLSSVKYNLLFNHKKYIYNGQQLIKTVDKPFLTKHTITKYKGIETDSFGNPTVRQIIVRTRLRRNTYIENTNYTYYD